MMEDRISEKARLQRIQLMVVLYEGAFFSASIEASFLTSVVVILPVPPVQESTIRMNDLVLPDEPFAHICNICLVHVDEKVNQVTRKHRTGNWG